MIRDTSDRRTTTVLLAATIAMGLIAGLCYAFACALILKNAGDPARIADLHHARAHFESKWVAWNIVRTALCAASFGVLAWALVRPRA